MQIGSIMLLLNINRLLIILIIVSCSVNAQIHDEPDANRTGTLKIHITGFKNDEGVARIALFHEEEGFPDNRKKAYWAGVNSIIENTSTLYISGIDYGTYAVSVFHDANNNGKIDKIWRIIPKEGFGTSNNIRDEEQGPSYKKSSFEIRADSTYITIEIKYLFGR